MICSFVLLPWNPGNLNRLKTLSKIPNFITKKTKRRILAIEFLVDLVNDQLRIREDLKMICF